MVNKVILVGRLAADPEVRATQTGMHVANLRVVTNSYAGKDEGGKRQEEAEFHRLVIFGRQAEIAGEHLRKGRLIFANGRLRTSSWEDAEGKKRSSTEVVVDEFKMLSPAS
ncbi:MAG TPA: single-stranded DNA-binding protein [Candidatus Dormibacteraeota bacterium]|jgi:single-strand DNA-binding protein|nr:single-stranded DNA-binding protein [Candidatus Dormibacteraeota bacterium]